ncbi:hypothetical protein TanjilG_22396 [Lupinus angustifolius]|uniref:procollagen-proline 4-dioxygenase n=1 Tax=Lupinus angustifolius TaxID=3871 RepID=A0A4P1RSU9_LUPAN|nr:hypothetical protein TanjilG_22396 [Lupinus angustifolius]
MDKVIADIEARIATWTFLPYENGEGMQILRYEHGQKYEPHFDYLLDKLNQQFGGHRIATILMYLSNVKRGGETVFPNSDPTLSQPKDESWSECAKMGYAVKPKKGDALLFFNLLPNATIDNRSLHGSCPVIEGEKWSATKWIHDKVIADIEARIATWTFLPYENGEDMQILHYEDGQKYEPHFDYLLDKFNQQFGGHRIATVLMYLSNVKKGGETVFPNSDPTLSQPKDESWSECAKMGYAVKPKKGDALLFFNLLPNATIDTRSLHGSCPVIEGEKWSATKWIHVRDFDNSFKQVYSENCKDENEECSMWAKIGECEKNPLYMVGSGTIKGHCMKSCNACSS